MTLASMPFTIGKVYNFSTLAQGILEVNYQNVKHLGAMGYELAQANGLVPERYRQVYPALPPGAPRDPALSTYHLFRHQNGQLEVLSEHWIDVASVTEVAGVTFSILFQNGDINNIEPIRQLLQAAGYTGFTIQQ